LVSHWKKNYDVTELHGVKIVDLIKLNVIMNQIRGLLFLFFCVAYSSLKAQNPSISNLVVTIEGNVKQVGSVFVALYNNETDFLTAEIMGKSKIVDGSALTFNFDSLRVGGRYAIALFHDQNNNKQMDKNLFGLPQEPYAFGNNSMGFMGPPSFFDASVVLKLSDNVMVIKLD
jgi:uncharacterized protein (DUF2141 family)